MYGYIYIYTYACICTYDHMYIYMHMHICIYISPQLVHARLCNGAATSLPWNLQRTYLESCGNIVQGVISARPPAPSSNPKPAVVLHKHHLIIRVGAGLIQFVYGSHSCMTTDLTLDKNLFSQPFSRVFETDGGRKLGRGEGRKAKGMRPKGQA